MIYADYAYYTGIYAGTAISSDAFAASVRRASAFIDRITYNRLNTGCPVTDAVKMATCAVADAMEASAETERAAIHSAAIKSESVDGDSTTYQSPGDIREALETQWAETAEQYLLFTGLMDRGLC
jgi:hypothetical protein